MKLTKSKLADQLGSFAEYLQGVGAELFREAFKTQGIRELSVQQLRYLEIIEAKPGISPRDLVAIFQVRKPTVSNIVNRLVLSGLIKRVGSAADKRTWCLHPTIRTKKIFQKRRNMYLCLATHIANKLDKSETDALMSLFNKILSQEGGLHE